MPTLSQCQILNSLIEKNLVSNKNGDVGSTEVQEPQPRSIAIVECATSKTPQPEKKVLLFENENPRSVSVNGRLETEDSDLDITPFQINRMEMAVNTMKIVSAWRPSSLWKKDFDRNFRSSLYLWNIRNNLFQGKKPPSKTTKDKVLSQDVDARELSPLNIVLRRRHILISPVLDDISSSLKPRHRPRVLTAPNHVQTSGEESPAEEELDDKHQEDTDLVGKDEQAVAAADKPEEADGNEDGDFTDEKMGQFMVPKYKRFFNVKCPDDVKDQLYSLGWRQPRKKKKKGKKNKEHVPRFPRLSYMTVPKQKLDLSNDPMLIKLSKKSKIMMKHTQAPEKKPKAVCFDIYGAHLTHLLVWKSFQRDVLSEFDEVTVESIQFSPRSLFFPRTKTSEPVENRWIITLTNEWYRCRVTGVDIHFGEFTATLRRYDDVIGFEYRQYTRMANMMKMVRLKPPGLEVISVRKQEHQVNSLVEARVETKVET